MVRRTQSEVLMFADFLELVRDDQKADLIDGVVYLASPENRDHNLLKWWLSTVLGQYVEHHRLGTLFADKFTYRLTDLTAPEPDLAFVHNGRMHLVQNGYMDGGPDSVDRDYELKRRRYEESGVGEYWIIDPMEDVATFLVWEPAGYLEVFAENHVYRSRVLPGLWLDVRWLWQRPLPPTLPIVRRLLDIKM
jgi:Uma2 family endonuclease